jgi:hypothetical protein
VLFEGVAEVVHWYKTQLEGKHSPHLKNNHKEGQHFCEPGKTELLIIWLLGSHIFIT